MKTVMKIVLLVVIATFTGCSERDQDGNKLKTVKIGEQIWMAQNLNVEHYRNGDIIPQIQDPDKWMSARIGAWCYYENKPLNGELLGKLYNWYAINDLRGLAPAGWHIPTYAEFEKLAEAVNQNGNSLKAMSQGNLDGAGNNNSGFSALLAGCRFDTGPFFSTIGFNTIYWSSSEYSSNSAYYMLLGANFSKINFGNNIKEFGQSVRCVKD